MSKAELVEQEVKVEWDPERHEESMAAILAWVPKGVKLGLICMTPLQGGAYSVMLQKLCE